MIDRREEEFIRSILNPTPEELKERQIRRRFMEQYYGYTYEENEEEYIGFFETTLVKDKNDNL
jgi:hypothetical protein